MTAGRSPHTWKLTLQTHCERINSSSSCLALGGFHHTNYARPDRTSCVFGSCKPLLTPGRLRRQILNLVRFLLDSFRRPSCISRLSPASRYSLEHAYLPVRLHCEGACAFSCPRKISENSCQRRLGGYGCFLKCFTLDVGLCWVIYPKGPTVGDSPVTD